MSTRKLIYSTYILLILALISIPAVAENNPVLVIKSSTDDNKLKAADNNLRQKEEIDHAPYTGKRTCIKSNGTTYCADRDFGGIFIYKGSAYCGAGKCLSKHGNVYCSQYPGGDIIRNNTALWTGPGECVKFNGNVRCAKEPMGACIYNNGNVWCQGGWVKELPVKARRCEASEIFR